MPVSLTEISIAWSTSRSTGWLGLQPSVAGRTDKRHAALGGEFEGVGQQVEHDLLQPLFVGADGRAAALRRTRPRTARPFSEASWRKVRSMCCLRPASGMSPISIDDGAGFDLRQVENVVDQVEQVGAGAVDGARELDLLLVEVALLVVGQQLRQDQQRVERGAQLVAHVGQELGLVLGGQRQLLGLLLDRAAGHVDLEVLGFDLALLVLEQLRLFLQLLVGVVQLFLLGGELGLAGLQLLGQQLRLREQALGAHRRGDGVEHDADRFHQLVEEAVVGLVELLERGELDHRLDLVLEQGRQDVDVDRRRLAEAGADLDEVARHLARAGSAACRRPPGRSALRAGRTASSARSWFSAP